MDLITFRCTACKQGLKVGADKAGRKVKCTKCGTPLTVPQAAGNNPASVNPPAPKPAKSRFDDDDEDAGGVYGVEGLNTAPAAPTPPPDQDQPPPRAKRTRDEDDEDDEEEDDEEDEEAREENFEELRRRLMGEDEDEEEEDADDEDQQRTRHKGKAKLDAPAWQKVRVGIMVVVISAGILAGALLFYEIYILIGFVAGKQYASVLQEIHPDYQNTPEEKDKPLKVPKLIVGLVGGTKALTVNTILVITSQVLELLSHGVLIAGCAICLAVPARFGTRGLVMATLVVAGVNVVTTLIFKLLTQMGVIPFTLVPLLGREMAMLTANEERTIPLQLFWGDAPYLQVVLSILLIGASYLELVLFPLFLRAVGKFLKSEKLEESALALVELALGQMFIQMAYQMLAMTGTSDVLGWVLRSVYAIGLGFFILQLVWYILLLLKSRGVIQYALDHD